MTLIFNNNIPATFFKVQQVGSMVQIKPYASYHVWLDWFDLAPLDFSPAIDILTELILDVNDIATDALVEAAAASAAASTAQAAADAAQTDADSAQSTANTGVTNAAAAQSAADAAQSEIDALEIVVSDTGGSIADQLHGRATIWWDEATLVTGTKAASRIAGMDYGVGYHAGGSSNNEMKISFVADLYSGGTLFIHCVTNNGAGIATVVIDDLFVANIDFYSASQTLNAIKSAAIAADNWASGRHTLKIRSTTKHASSSAYFLVITKVWFTDNND